MSKPLREMYGRLPARTLLSLLLSLVLGPVLLLSMALVPSIPEALKPLN